jgi:hypothetical protein
MNKIMKKMYIQPNVEAAEVKATSLMQAGSPATGNGIVINDPNNPGNQISGD